MAWDRESLWAKAKLFTNYAQEAEDDDLRKPLWFAFALELLARAALANVHPCLLADIRGSGEDSNAANLLFACGIKIQDRVVSVKASTVFARCKHIVTGFTKTEEGWCNDFLAKRNEDVHTGSLPYFHYKIEQWQTEYYKVSQLLLRSLDLQLIDLFGPQASTVAASLIEDQKKHIKKTTLDAVEAAKRLVAGLLPTELQQRRKSLFPQASNSEQTKCPAGDHSCLRYGEVTHITAPRLLDGNIAISRTIIPTGMTCLVCGLKLVGNASMNDAGIGTPYQIHDVQDPVEFHGIDVREYVTDEDIRAYYEPDYGND